MKVIMLLFIVGTAWAQSLNLTTYNTGMFEMPVIKVPYYSERLPYLPISLSGVQSDIFALQELWHIEDHEVVKKFASENHFFYFAGEFKKHGLAFLIRKSAVERVEFQQYYYNAQMWYERLLGYRKGALMANIVLSSGQKIQILNTHLTAVVENDIRERQAQELMELGYEGIRIVMGDLNMTPDFPELTYGILMGESSSLDCYRKANPYSQGYTYSKQSNPVAAKKNNNDKETRLDYILVTNLGHDSSVSVLESHLVFTEDLPLAICQVENDGTLFPCKQSDHYGVFAKLEFSVK